MAALVWKKVVPLRRRLLWINNQQSVRDYSDNIISSDELKNLFEEWAIRFDKVYKTVEEKEKKFLVFQQHFWKVKNHNLSPTTSPGDRFALYGYADSSREPYFPVGMPVPTMKKPSIK